MRFQTILHMNNLIRKKNQSNNFIWNPFGVKQLSPKCICNVIPMQSQTLIDIVMYIKNKAIFDFDPYDS